MKLIRKGVFETNSSSCHSISIGSGDVYDSITPAADGTITVHQGDFGWEYESYSDVYSRLQYAATFAHQYNGNEDWMVMLNKVVCEHTGATQLVVEGSGYVDHQSSDCGYEMFESESSLKDFIFNADSSFETDNDNH